MDKWDWRLGIIAIMVAIYMAAIIIASAIKSLRG